MPLAHACQLRPNHSTVRRRLLGVLSGLLSCALLAACGSQNSSTIPITITFTQGFLPPTSMMEGDSCGIAATVANDPKNAGVNWSVACASEPQCGSFSAFPTSSGVPVTYTAPGNIPAGDGTVTVTATSVTDPTKFVSSSPIPITQNASVNCVKP